jgi:hypothetical protein
VHKRFADLCAAPTFQLHGRYRSGFRSRFLLGLESRTGLWSIRDSVARYSWQLQALKGFEGLPPPDTATWGNIDPRQSER